MSETPAPLAELARYCVEHPKLVGYVERAWIEEGDARLPAHKIVSHEVSLDAACEKMRKAVDAIAGQAGRIWWRALPQVTEISGWTGDEDTFGDDPADNYIAVKFARPYYIVRTRVVADPDLGAELQSAMVTPEGGAIAGFPSIEEFRSLCGVEMEWSFTDADRPNFIRQLHTPLPADATITHPWRGL